MSTRRVALVVGVLAAATYTATAARTMTRTNAPQGIEEDSLRPGPDSARVAKLLDALGRTDRLVCDLVADQLGNFWWDGDRDGLGALADASAASRASKDSLGGRVRDPRAVSLLAFTLRSDEACVRRAAAKMLGHSAAGTDQIVKLLYDPAPRVREAAALALGAGERKGAREALEKGMSGGDEALAAMSAWALAEIHDSASLPALTRAVRASNALVRLGAVRGLGEIGAEASAGVLAAALQDASAGVRYAAASALGDLHDLRQAPPALVQAANTGDARLKRLVAQALAEIRDPATVDVLIGMLTSPDRGVRLHVVQALGEIRSSKAAPGLVRALKDPDAEVRRAAAEALGELKEGT